MTGIRYGDLGLIRLGTEVFIRTSSHTHIVEDPTLPGNHRHGHCTELGADVRRSNVEEIITKDLPFASAVVDEAASLTVTVQFKASSRVLTAVSLEFNVVDPVTKSKGVLTDTLVLADEGTIDWAHWGLNGPNSFNHKGGITQQITNFTLIGTGALGWFLDSSNTFSWVNGTPTLSTSNTQTGVNTNGVVGNGFEINMPADTNLKSLKLYVGVWFAQGKLEATLSDGSAPAFINASLNNNEGGDFRSLYDKLQGWLSRTDAESQIHDSESVPRTEW